MRNIDEHNITDAVIARFESCRRPAPEGDPDARWCATCTTSCARRRLTEAEWLDGIDFLTATGHMHRRQAPGVHPAVRHARRLDADRRAEPRASPRARPRPRCSGRSTSRTRRAIEHGADIADGAPGEPLFVDATVRGPTASRSRTRRSTSGRPTRTASTTSSDPRLGRPAPRARGAAHRCARAAVRFRSSRCRPRTRCPPTARSAACSSPPAAIRGGRRTCTSASGRRAISTLTTHVFRAGDPYLDSDVVFGVRSSLVADYVSHAAGTGPHAGESDRDYHTLDFDFVLAREAMTMTAD